MCRPRLPAACLAPECPDPPGERIPGVSYFGCSPASRAKLLATLSPREDVWPGRSARAPGLPLHRECGGWESPAPRAVILSLSAYSTRLSQALVGSVDPVCPGLTAPGALPLAQRLRLPPGPTTVVAPWGRASSRSSRRFYSGCLKMASSKRSSVACFLCSAFLTDVNR